MRTITIMSHNRPKYLRKVLRSLILNDLDDWTVVLGQNATNELEKCVHVALSTLAERCDVQIHVPKRSKCVRDNPYYLQEFAFGKLGSELNILLEDDTPVSNDITDLALAYLKQENKGLMLSFNKFGRTEQQGPVEIIEKRPYYTQNLAYACTPDAWNIYLKRWWHDNNHGLDGNGYDYSIHGHSKLENQWCYGVACSRVTHIGAEGGVHPWHDGNRWIQAIFDSYTPPRVEKPVQYTFQQ